MKVLIVDDDRPTVEVIAGSMNWQKLGIDQVFTAFNVTAARRIIMENDIAIVISDIEMPRETGLDLLAWYREQGYSGQFMLLTCHERFDFARIALKYQAADYLLKPFDNAAMEQTLERMIHRIRHQRDGLQFSAAETGEPADADAVTDDLSAVFDIDVATLNSYLQGKQKIEFLSYIKSHLVELQRNRRLTEPLLEQMQMVVIQAVYTYLGNKHINGAALFSDANISNLSESASKSVIDMMRWITYLIEQTFAFEESFNRSFSLGDQVLQYIRDHYAEPLDRNILADQFCLAPEYLAKKFKKETGKTVNDAIAEQRVAAAKVLLDRGERVSDVADRVGFENFTWFSTTFKKYAGISPAQYRKK
ncbi:MAG: response regulator [Treponemataceae bacterium]|nr:response regulator [Treponemataceae bacterium]